MIDVHIGFMDEEVSELLRLLIMQEIPKGRPVLAIERGRHSITDEDLNIFQRPFAQYDFNQRISESDTSQVISARTVFAEEDREIEDRLAWALVAEYFGDLEESGPRFSNERLLSRVEPSTELKVANFENPELTVFRFSKGPKQRGAPIIVVRNPEMGKQPSLVRPYLRAIMKAISTLEEARSKDSPGGVGVRVHSFATGGGIREGLRPGHISRVQASLYAGHEVHHGRVYAIIAALAIIPQDGLPRAQHLEFFRQETVASMDRQAKAMSSEEFKAALVEAEQLVSDVLRRRDYSLMRAALAHIDELYRAQVDDFPYTQESAPHSPTPDISLTVPFFDGLDFKRDVQRKLGGTITNSNMEDYHVLRVIQSMLERGGVTEGHKYAPLQSFSILRLVANTIVPRSVEEKLSRWMYLEALPTLTEEALVGVLLWGLYGCKRSRVKRCLTKEIRRWSFIKTLSSSELDWLYRFRASNKLTREDYDELCYLDPLACEIASDFLSDMIAGAALTGVGDSSELAKMAGELKAEATKLGHEDLKELVIDYVNRLRGTALFNSERGCFYYWLRRKKWMLQEVFDEEARELLRVKMPDVDRLLYVSAKAIGLQTLARIAAAH
ncbi:MAG: hypothetical protein R3A51_15205 [Nannocystaceae bacterium]|nr:hypothetical protein [Myxococcales bacterium]